VFWILRLINQGVGIKILGPTAIVHGAAQPSGDLPQVLQLSNHPLADAAHPGVARSACWCSHGHYIL